MKLIIDDRERCVIPFFKNEYDGIEIEIKRINIGDYAIFDGTQLLFIIERKTWKDLAASIVDGRKENINKLLLAREETNCKIVYLIEGKARHAASKKFNRIPYKNLQAHLDHLIMRDNIYIIYSNNLEDTAERLIEFTNNYAPLKKNEPPAIISRPSATGGEEKSFSLTQKFTKSELEITYAVWRCVPGITDKTTSLFIDDYHISDLVLGNIPKEDIATMRYPNGAIIGKRADKIYKITEATPETFNVYCNMLACISGVTKKTAALIITKFGFNELLSKQINLEDLSALKKTEKSNIGKKISADILRIFTKDLTQ